MLRMSSTQVSSQPGSSTCLQILRVPTNQDNPHRARPGSQGLRSFSHRLLTPPLLLPFFSSLL